MKKYDTIRGLRLPISRIDRAYIMSTRICLISELHLYPSCLIFGRKNRVGWTKPDSCKSHRHTFFMAEWRGTHGLLCFTDTKRTRPFLMRICVDPHGIDFRIYSFMAHAEAGEA